MKTYPKYKESGVEWIGEIPKHWELKKLKYVANLQPSNVDKKSFDSEEPVLLCNYVDVYKNEYIDSTINFMKATATFDEIDKFKISKGDIIVTKDSETPEDIANPALVKENFDNVICGYHLTQIRPNRQFLLGEYLFRLFQCSKYKGQFEVGANGVTRYGLSISAFKDAFVSIPPISEQTQIAHYLDQKTAIIDKLVTGKQKLIALLNEEKAAIIQNAVTKGVNTEGVVFKDSGVEWLGEIPRHWKLTNLRYIVTKIGSGVTPSGGAAVYKLEGIPLLRSQNIHFDGLKLADVAYITEEIDESMSNSRVYSGDVLLNVTGGSIGRCFYIDENFGRGNVNQHVCIVRPIQNLITTKFLYFILRSNLGQSQIDICQTGGNREGLNFEQIKSFMLGLPTIEEQNQIIGYIELSFSKIDSTIQKIEREIELLKEYRTALISEAVTGKIDLREIKN